MSAALICSDYVRKLVSLFCLLALPAAAQQPDVKPHGPPAGPQAPVAVSNQPAVAPAAPLPNTPAPQANLPQPTRVVYSKPVPLLPNPFARYAPRDVPPP